MKKTVAVLLALFMVLSLAACGTKPAETTKAPETQAPETKAPETKAPETKAPETQAPETKAPETEAPAEELADPNHEIWTAHGNYLLPDGTANNWNGKDSEIYEATALTAIKLEDVKAIDEDLYNALAAKEVKYLYTIDLLLGTNDAGWTTNCLIDGKLHHANGSYALKVAQCTVDIDGSNKVYAEDQWVPDAKTANAESLTPATLFMPAWQEEKDENGFDWTANPVAIAGSGVYTLVAAQYKNASSPENPGFGFGLVLKEAKDGIAYEEVVDFIPADHTYGVIGSFEASGWGTDVAMEDKGDGSWSAEVELKADDEFKVRADGDWTDSWGADGYNGANFKCEADGTYIVTITFDGGNGTVTAELKGGEETGEVKLVSKVAILNTLVKDLEAVKDEENGRYQATWVKAHNFGKFAENNFWFEIDDEEAVAIMAYTDLYTYTDGLTFGLIKDQGVCMGEDIPESMRENYAEGFFCGTGIKKDQHPYQAGYVVIGPEAVLLIPEDGFFVTDVFADLDMVEADSYDFICADGYTQTYEKDELDEVEVFFNEDGGVDATYLPDSKYTLMNILYIVPHDLTDETAADFELPEEGIVKITVFNTAIGDEEADMDTNFGGTVQEGYKVADIMEAAGFDEVETVTAIGYEDGKTLDQSYADFIEKFIVLTDSKDRGAYTMGRTQQYGDVLTKVGLYTLDNNALFYVPSTATQEEGACALTDLLAALGIEDAECVKIICSDDFSEEIAAEDFADVFFFNLEDRVDATSIAYAGYTLNNAEFIEIYK